ncbi:hypothetical protein CRYUN_Cryun06bG0087700 [Craigia yunnanensis]
MGNASGREDGANDGVDDLSGRSNGIEPVVRGVAFATAAAAVRMPSSDSMANTTMHSPRRYQSPLLFAPQKVLATAKDLEKRSVYHIRFLEGKLGDICFYFNY